MSILKLMQCDGESQIDTSGAASGLPLLILTVAPVSKFIYHACLRN